MKYYNISYSITSLLGSYILPSQLKILNEYLSENLEYSIEHLCRKSVFVLQQVPGLTSDTIHKVTALLKHYGLRLGMTDRQISEYKDNKFLSEHPDYFA